MMHALPNLAGLSLATETNVVGEEGWQKVQEKVWGKGGGRGSGKGKGQSSGKGKGQSSGKGGGRGSGKGETKWSDLGASRGVPGGGKEKDEQIQETVYLKKYNNKPPPGKANDFIEISGQSGGTVFVIADCEEPFKAQMLVVAENIRTDGSEWAYQPDYNKMRAQYDEQGNPKDQNDIKGSPMWGPPGGYSEYRKDGAPNANWKPEALPSLPGYRWRAAQRELVEELGVVDRDIDLEMIDELCTTLERSNEGSSLSPPPPCNLQALKKRRQLLKVVSTDDHDAKSDAKSSCDWRRLVDDIRTPIQTWFQLWLPEDYKNSKGNTPAAVYALLLPYTREVVENVMLGIEETVPPEDAQKKRREAFENDFTDKKVETSAVDWTNLYDLAKKDLLCPDAGSGVHYNIELQYRSKLNATKEEEKQITYALRSRYAVDTIQRLQKLWNSDMMQIHVQKHLTENPDAYPILRLRNKERERERILILAKKRRAENEYAKALKSARRENKAMPKTDSPEKDYGWPKFPEWWGNIFHLKEYLVVDWDGKMPQGPVYTKGSEDAVNKWENERASALLANEVFNTPKPELELLGSCKLINDNAFYQDFRVYPPGNCCKAKELARGEKHKPTGGDASKAYQAPGGS